MVSTDILERMPQLTIRILKENLSIDTTRANEGRVQRLNLVGSHDDLDVTTVVETVQLVQEFQHSSLNFSLTSRGRFVTLGTNGIDFINEDNRGGILSSCLKQLSD